MILNGKVKEAFELLDEETLDLHEKWEKLALKAKLLDSQGEYDKSLTYSDQLIGFGEQYGDKFIETIGKITKSITYWRIGKTKSARNILQEGHLFEGIVHPNFPYWFTLGHNLMGNIALGYGEYDIALDFYNSAFDLSKTIDNPRHTGSSLNNIAEVYKMKGSLDTALKYYLEALKYCETTDTQLTGVILNNLGEIYRLLGKSDDAQSYFMKSLQIKTNFGDKISIAETLLRLLICAIESKDTNNINKFHDNLVDLAKSSNLVRLDIKLKIADGLICKNSTRIIDLAKAQEIFTDLSEDSTISLDETIFSLLNLCDLLIFELKTYEEEELFMEIHKILNRLYKIGQDQALFNLIIEVLFLKAKVAFLEGITDHAFLLLDQALIYSQEKNIQHITEKITRHHEEITQEFNKWITLFNQQSSMQSKIEKLRVEEYLSDLINIYRSI